MKREQRQANRERWQLEIEAWRASGKGLSVWARERGLSRDALEYWKRRIPVAQASRRRLPLTLIPLRPEPPAAVGATPIELVDDRQPGLRIRLPAGFDAASLARVLDLLEARC
jgi:hypothetical protein